jgi:hypothetical protein
LRVDRSEVPPNRPVPAVGRERPFELDLPPVELGRVGEVFGALSAVGIDYAQLVASVEQIPDFVPEKLTAPLKPPEHKSSCPLSA